MFKNREEAGASLEHSHIQLIATPIIPKRAMEELDGAQFHFKLKERCIFCDVIKQEIEVKKRIIFINDFLIAIAPYARDSPSKPGYCLSNMYPLSRKRDPNGSPSWPI